MPALTIGVMHHQKLKSLAATIKALRRDHDLADVDLMVIDTKSSKKARRWVRRQHNIRYAAIEPGQKSSALDQLFEQARGEVVLVLQDPVRLRHGSLQALDRFFACHPDSNALVHGLTMSGKRVIATHSDPFWRRNSWGSRANKPSPRLGEGLPFVIPMQESGVFSCRRSAWPGMPSGWRGYGGEDGFLQERFRREGAQVVCLPGLQWERIAQVRPARPYSQQAVQVLRNHLAGAADLDLDTRYITLRHRDRVAPGVSDRLRNQALRKREKDGQEFVPLVSCLLYAGRLVPKRQRLLEESVESFLRQSYRNKELILFNDAAEQRLVCEAPGVRVINVSTSCPSLGDCYNAAVAFAQGDVLAIWDASSIDLPWRLEVSLRELGDHEVFRPDACWYMLDGELESRPGQPEGGHVAMLTREAYRAIGGFPSITLGLHRAIDGSLDQWRTLQGTPPGETTLSRADWFTILRRRQKDAGYWGDPFLDPWQAQSQLPSKRGRFVLKPQWDKDYVALCLERLSREDTSAPPPLLPVPFVLSSGKRDSRFHFPRLNRAKGETEECHLERVTALVSAAVDAGGTHLVIPRGESEWLSDHEYVAEYLATQHSLIHASSESGFVFSLQEAEPARIGRKVATHG